MRKLKRIIKELINITLNKKILYHFGFTIKRRDDSSPNQLRNLFNKKEKNLYLIDCGAYIGEFTKDFLKLFPNSKCICIEPSPKSFKKLKNLFRKNINVTLVNVGLFDEKAEREIFINQSEKTNSFFDQDKDIPECQKEFHTGKSKSLVKLEKLDKVIKKENFIDQNSGQIDILKIDVQGSELKLLKGALETLKVTKYILIEIHFIRSYKSSPLFMDIHNFLNEKGFEFQRFYDLVEDPSNRNRMIYGDALFKKIN